jgi:hypothetical protein
MAQTSQRQRRDGGRPSGNSNKIRAVRPSKDTNAKPFTQAIRPAHPNTLIPLADA